jgi:hypothetical protein
MPTHDRIADAKDNSVDLVLNPPASVVNKHLPSGHWLARNFLGVGIGWKITKGQIQEGERVLRIYVRAKIHPDLLGPFHVDKLLKGQTNGVPTDVVELGCFRGMAGPAGPTIRLGVGADVQLAGSSAHGTLCAFVQADNDIHLLSCSHVLDGHQRTGQAVLSQGVVVARLSKQDSLLPEGIASGQIDCARATVLRAVNRSYDLPHGMGRLSSAIPIPAHLGMAVQKVGRDVSDGVVVDTDADIRVDFNAVTTVLKHQILVRGRQPLFAFPGDSGSMVITDNGSERRAIGMLCAAGGGPNTAMVVSEIQPNWAAVSPMQDVLDRLGARLYIRES